MRYEADDMKSNRIRRGVAVAAWVVAGVLAWAVFVPLL